MPSTIKWAASVHHLYNERYTFASFFAYRAVAPKPIGMMNWYPSLLLAIIMMLQLQLILLHSANAYINPSRCLSVPQIRRAQSFLGQVPGLSSSSSSRLALADGVILEDVIWTPPTLVLAAATVEPWVQPAIYILDPFLNVMSLAMLARVVISWYPQMETDTTKQQWWIKAAIIPTEGLLRAVRGFIPPAFGVDITPVFWIAIFTFLHEVLLGQQGLLVMKLKYGL